MSATLGAALVAVAFLALSIGTASAPVEPRLLPSTGSEEDPSSGLFPSPNERFGFGVTSNIKHYDVGLLHAGWYVNWGTASEVLHPAGLEYVQVIRINRDGTYRPSRAALLSILRDNPGLTWIVGNEIDCPYQDAAYPTVYAPIYHDLYHFLKEQDPTCQVAIGGVVQATPLRLQYLDLIWDAYQTLYGERMPVDVWNVHNFILREKRAPPDNWGCGIPPGVSASEGELREIEDHDRMDLFEQQIRAFRAWMAGKGERDKPLMISEYGILFSEELGFGYDRVRDFILATFDYLLAATDPDTGCPADGNRLVQRWAWYSLDDERIEWGTIWSNLFDPTTREIESLGQEFATYIVAHDLIRAYYDLRPAAFTADSADAPVYGQPATLTLSARVMNWGNRPTDAFLVSFWDGEILVDEPAVSTVGPRYEGETMVGTSWSGVITMSRAFRVVVDSGHQVEEWQEDNNVAMETVEIDLAVEELRGSVPLVQPGQIADITVTATVSNLGDVAVPEVSFQLHDGTSGDPIGTTATGQLGPGDRQGVSLTWPHQPAGSYAMRGVVDAENVIIESDEGNNEVWGMALVATSRTFLPFVARGGEQEVSR